MREYFEKHPPSWNDFDKVQVLLEDPRSNPGITGTLKTSAFEPVAQALSFSSLYQKQLRKIRDKPDRVVIFRVLDDAHENYLALRELSDRADIAAGWEFGGNDLSLRAEITDPIIDPNATPTPTPKPTASGTPFIPAPSLKLD